MAGRIAIAHLCESGEIGIHARLRIWCFGVRVRVPSLAKLLRRQTQHPANAVKNYFCGNSSVVERNLAKVDVAGPIPVSRLLLLIQKSSLRGYSVAVIFCGNSSVVERNLAKVDVAGPIPVSRSKAKAIWSNLNRFFYMLEQSIDFLHIIFF